MAGRIACGIGACAGTVRQWGRGSGVHRRVLDDSLGEVMHSIVRFGRLQRVFTVRLLHSYTRPILVQTLPPVLTSNMTSKKDDKTTISQKQGEGKDGKKYTSNTVEPRKSKNKDAERNGSEGKQKDFKNAKDYTEHWEDPEHLERNQKLLKKFQ